MRRTFWLLTAVSLLAVAALAQYGGTRTDTLRPYGTQPQSAAKPDFQITATYIEACSCDMFCPCYFGQGKEGYRRPTVHHGSAHFCNASLPLRVDKGYYKDVNLDGLKVWAVGDLGGEFHTGKGNWLVVVFDPTVTKAQQEAMTDILLQLYGLEWNILGVDTIPIEWKIDDKAGVATTRLGNGKGEVILERVKGDNPRQEVVIRNLKYWNAQSNTGFRMWRNKRHYYEGHGQKFDYSGTNGFLITMTFSGQAKKAAAD